MKKIVSIVLLLGVLCSCSTLDSQNDTLVQHTSPDPLEKFNRAMFAFNNTTDKIFFRPIAVGYDKVLPKPAKKGVTNFFNNLSEPWSMTNNFLQGKFDDGLRSFYRFTVNSTLGIFGLFDVAKLQGVEPVKEDLGQTLAAWGVKPGAYIVLPFLGPTNVRDGIGRTVQTNVFYPINEISDSSNTRFSLVLTNAINQRSRFLNIDILLKEQIDPYIFMKNGYETFRVKEIYDGNPPEDTDIELDF